ncbi:MAG TPA: HlyD family type I secretion periplasmic adaptor subunit [Candidatus Binatia bacterium]|nr:HlyD family type I secretion periplasmic adaptor subunit [Candidatus Binatia bacterium]
MTLAPVPQSTRALDQMRQMPHLLGGPVPTSPWPVIWVGVGVMILFFGVLGGWAAVAPLASAVTAAGTLAVSGENKVVQHLDGGIIREILVKNGDKVKQGQILLRLDDTQAKASVELLRAQYLSFLALEARLQAERDDQGTIVFPKALLDAAGQDDVQEMMTGQTNLFQERKRTLDGQVSVLEQRIKQLKQQIGGASVQQQAQDEQLALIQDELNSARQLYDKGYVPKTRILELERAAAALSGQSGQYRSSQASTQQAIGEAQLQILQLKKERLSEVTQDLSDTQDKINAMEERLHSANDVLARTVIAAPAAGTVLNMTANTIGGVVAPGGRILEIVPGDVPLVINAAVRPEDIADMKPGLKTEIRLTAYNQRSTGILHGTLTEISADRIVSQQDPKGHFEIKTVITDDLSQTPGIEIVPGMPAIVTIPVKQRTVLEYIVGPLTDYFASGMREK